MACFQDNTASIKIDCEQRISSLGDKLEGSRAVIEAERARHLHVVLRVEVGKVFEVTDAPRLYLTPVVASTKRGGGVCARIMVVVGLRRRRDDQLNARFVDDFFRSGPRAGMHGAHDRLAPVPAWRTAPRRGSYPRRAKLPTREDPENPVWSARRKPIQPTVLLPPSPNSVPSPSSVLYSATISRYSVIGVLRV